MNKVEEVPSDSLPSWKTKQWRLENRLDRLGVSHLPTRVVVDIKKRDRLFLPLFPIFLLCCRVCPAQCFDSNSCLEFLES